jgi:hypothetical protein
MQLSSAICDELAKCNLVRLELQHLAIFSEENLVIDMLNRIHDLEYVDFTGNAQISDDVIVALINNHKDSLEVVILNGLECLTERSLLLLVTKVPHLRVVDVSWCR